MTVVLGWVMALAFPLALLDSLQVPRVVLFAVCMGAALPLPLVFARFCRFEAATRMAREMPEARATQHSADKP